MIPRRSERVLRNKPALGEDDEIDIRRAGRLRRRGQHRKDRGVSVIVKNGADRRVAPQIIFVWCIIAVPGHDIERRMLQCGAIELAAPFDVKFGRNIAVFISRDWGHEVA